MREWDKYTIILTVLFVFVFLSRIYFSIQNPYFTYESYYHLRHIEHISQDNIPLYNDPLSYGGRTHYFPPLFHYMFSIPAKIIPLEFLANAIPSLLFSFLIILVYKIAMEITGSKNYSLIAAFFYSFTPIGYIFPINNVNPYSLVVPLFFLIFYLMIKDKIRIFWLVLAIIILVMTHPSAFLLVIGFAFYYALLQMDGMKLSVKTKEIMLFTTFLVLWALSVVYKNVFLNEGVGAIWQNIPDPLVAAAFPTLDIFQIIYFVGIVPLYFGTLSAYSAVFGKASKENMLLLGFTLAVFILLWLNFLRLSIGLLFLSVSLSILSAEGFKARADYMKKTRFAKWHAPMMFSVLFFFTLSSAIPLFYSASAAAVNTPTSSQIETYQWLKNNTESSAMVVTSLPEGHLVTYFSQRRNFMDANFINMDDVNARFNDLRKMYTVRFKSEPLSITTKYGIDYIILSDLTRDQYAVTTLYYSDDNCFSQVYNASEIIYKVTCKGQNE